MCAFENDYILKFEHFAEESEEFMQSANLTQYLPNDKMVDFHKIVNNNHQHFLSAPFGVPLDSIFVDRHLGRHQVIRVQQLHQQKSLVAFPCLFS